MRKWVAWLCNLGRASRERADFSSSNTRGSRRRRGQAPLALETLDFRTVMAAGVVPTYTVVNNWTSGLQAEITLTNSQATSVTDWRLEFDYAANITSLWDGKITSHAGNHYVVASAGWNSTLSGFGSVSFGFVASPGGTVAAPVNYLVLASRCLPML